MLRTLLLVGGLIVVSGCSNNAAQREMSKPTESPTWDALKGLQTPEGMMGISLNTSMGNPEGVRTHVQTPKFQELASKFGSEPIPEKFKTPEREAAKAELDKHFKALIDGAKSMSDDQLKTEAQAAMDSFKKVASTPDEAATQK
jgi:hypothetical protein